MEQQKQLPTKQKWIVKMSDDPYLAILEHRNTPDDLASPNEKLMSRRTRSSIPVKPSLLEPYTNKKHNTS